jgi:2-oxo-4-hydroxy-4-carboxy-5-ureidoimidazoline decarboxylase
MAQGEAGPSAGAAQRSPRSSGPSQEERAPARFNALTAADCERELLACCASPRWARRVAAGRPYADVAALCAAGEAALGRLNWGDIAAALAAHPRIGDRPAGTDRAAAWSRREQSGVAGADPQVRAALIEANREYEERFGHVFLIFATGRTEDEILAAARSRLGNDEETERTVVREELGRITRLRLSRLAS